MKIITSLALFILFTVVVVFGFDHLYERSIQDKQSSKVLQKSNADKTVAQSKSNTATSTKKDLGSTQKVSEKVRILKVSNTPPSFLAGFDWRLPDNTQMTPYSGLITENPSSEKKVNHGFAIVLWNESNPAPGVYDFSRFDKTLKRSAPGKVLVRLEVNSSCEAPNWALNKLRQTKQKSLIFWDKSYQELTAPFIKAFAERYAANPQIIGVQLGLADGEFGEAPDSCDNYDNKQGWGEFWMSVSERKEAEENFDFNADLFMQASLANIDIYANAFGDYKNKLAFTNIGTLFTYGEGSAPYNKNLKKIAEYVLTKGLGNRDGAIERWMSYTDKVYGSQFKTMPDGSCILDMNEAYIRQFKHRYWGTENEFYGNKDYVIADMGPVENHPYIFMISSLRALQMRRNFMSLTDMSNITHKDYKTQAFIKYLSLTMGKQYEDTPDAFVLMGERYIAQYRLKDQMDADCVSKNENTVKVRSFGRWLNESPENSQVENSPALKVRMPKEQNHWYQGFYLPHGTDYEYFARKAKTFAFNLNDQLTEARCKNACNVVVKATFKDTVKTKLHIEVAEGVSDSIETTGDNKIKTVSFNLRSKFDKPINDAHSKTDLRLLSKDKAIPLMLVRMNFL